MTAVCVLQTRSSITEVPHSAHNNFTIPFSQADGQVESTNKVIEAILTKTVRSHRKNWVDRLLESLWAYRTTWPNTMGFSPFDLVYGNNVVFPIEFEIRTLRTAMEEKLYLTEA